MTMTTTIKTYRISTDSVTGHYEARSADEAAANFAKEEQIRGVRTASDLAEYLERVGGYGFMVCDDDGEEIFDVQ